jgi:DNA-directed RNA polymerase subunit beta'
MALPTAKKSKIDSLVKKTKYLQALTELGMKPHEAYVLRNVPVIPPVMRPASLMNDGNIKYADINELYKNFALVNDKMKDKTIQHAEDIQKNLRANLYDGMKAIAGFGIPYADAKNKGLLHQLSGESPKKGFFQKNVMQKRQDLTMRSTIIPEPALGLDEVGLPKQHALDLFRPFLVKKLQDMGAAGSALEAQKVLARKDPIVFQALEKVMSERPILLKRDPALHKYSVQGFQPKMVDGNAIRIHPLVCGGFNADFDGDSMSVFVPITREAMAEAHKMKPTNNLFAESSGAIAYTPSLESALGLYKLSVQGKETKLSFTSPTQVIDAVRANKLAYNDVATLNGKKTTAGRVLLANAVPKEMQDSVMYDLSMKLDKSGLDKLLTHLGKNHSSDYDKSVNKLKDLGNHTSYGSVAIPTANSQMANIVDPKKQLFVHIGTHTLSLNDFHADTGIRDAVLKKANTEVKSLEGLKLTSAEMDRRKVVIYNEADSEMRKLHEKKMETTPNNLFTMYKAGVKPGWSQYKQMVLAPMLLKDSADRTIATPVTRSYSEGLDTAGYWTQMHGARRGSVMKVQEVQEPGVMSKLLMQTTMGVSIAVPDCGTTKGIHMSVTEKDIHDRVLAQDVKMGNIDLKSGTMLTPDIVGQVKAADKNAKLLVRSPIRCAHANGICQKCAGLSSTGNFHDIGTNIGVLAAHTIGERAVQLTLKSFHTGGVVEQKGAKALSSFGRFQQLTMLPQVIPISSSLAMNHGTITGIENVGTGTNIFIDGKKHFVGKDDVGNYLHQPLPGSNSWDGLKVGMKVQAGQTLSDPTRTYVNPHDLYKATKNIGVVQNHLASELYDLYKEEGIKRRHVETVVRAMSDLTKVVHPGDAENILHGEYQSLSRMQHLNDELAKQGKKTVEHTPIIKGVEMLPNYLQEDWVAKLQHRKLRSTIADAAATGARSNIHGTHPVPAIAYGAEVGMNKKDSLKPGLEHLKTIPEHHY